MAFSPGMAETSGMRITTLVSIAAAALLAATTASASPGLRLDRQDISPRQCMPAGSHARQVVDVHYLLLNDADSGFAGNYWANDSIFRHLRIWAESDGTYCVQVEDVGTFVTWAGTSPSGTSTVSAGVRGILDGGYITTDVVGTFAPTLPTHGYVGTYDLTCDQSGNCPGSSISWANWFSSVTSSNAFAQWGWIYHAGRHGTWLNQDDVAAANAGDITG
jgi:hypothetical protein